MVACSGGSTERGGRRRSSPAQRRSGGEWKEKPGLGASLEVWEGGSGVQTGNGVVQQRCHGELEFASANGERWRLCTRAQEVLPLL